MGVQEEREGTLGERGTQYQCPVIGRPVFTKGLGGGWRSDGGWEAATSEVGHQLQSGNPWANGAL